MTTPASSSGSTRLRGVDAARGAALLGVIIVHTLYEANPDGTPTWSYALFGGRSAAVFAVLAGLGIAFITGRRRTPLTAGRATMAGLAVRALVIAAIGLTLGYADASLATVILPYLAVMFLLAIPLVFLPTWIVAMIGVAVAIGVPALTHVLLPRLPLPRMQNPTVVHLFTDPLGLLTELSITGEYPALPWMAYLCAGLAIGRLNLTSRKVAVALLATGGVLAVAVSAASSMLLNRYGLAHIWAAQPAGILTGPETAEMLTLGGDGTTPTSTWWWLAANAPHTSTPFDLLSTTGTAIAVLGAMLLAGHLAQPALRLIVTVIQAPLAAAGSMTLTLYTAHITFINSGYDTYEAATGCLLQVAAVLLIGLAWRATAGSGPLEALTTALSARARRWATNRSRPRPAQHVAGIEPSQKALGYR